MSFRTRAAVPRQTAGLALSDFALVVAVIAAPVVALVAAFGDRIAGLFAGSTTPTAGPTATATAPASTRTDARETSVASTDPAHDAPGSGAIAADTTAPVPPLDAAAPAPVRADSALTASGDPRGILEALGGSDAGATGGSGWDSAGGGGPAFAPGAPGPAAATPTPAPVPAAPPTPPTGPATAAAPAAPVAPPAAVTPPAPPAAGTLRSLGNYRPTFYWLTHEDEFTGPANTAIFATNGALIGRFPAAFVRSLRLEGSGKLRDGRVLNVSERRGRFDVVDAPWGLGVRGIHLVPFRSVAVDPDQIAYGTTLYIPAARGIRLPDGSLHDGIFYAHDTGGAINGRRIDIFIGRRSNQAAWEGSGVHNMAATPVYRIVH